MSTAIASKYSSPLVAKYVAALIARPLLVKCATSGVLSFLQDILSSYLAGVKVSPGKSRLPLAHVLAKFNIGSKAFKMAIYGFFVSAPLGHYLNGTLQRAFAGKTSVTAKLGQLLVSNLFITPIQASVFLASMAIIDGAKSVDAILARVRAGLSKMVAIMWVVQPVSLAVATKFIPMELWVPFFNLVSFSLGLTVNTKMKQLQAKRDRRSG